MNAYGARGEIKELKICPKRLMYPEHVEKVLSKYIANVKDRNAPYLKNSNQQPLWLFANLALGDEEERDPADIDRYFEVKAHWLKYFSSGRRDPDNNNRPFSLVQATHTLAPNELEAYIYLAASISGKDE